MSFRRVEERLYLSHLSLTNFRNFTHVELDLPPGIVVFTGRNAQGKSSLIEAIYLLAIARSFRGDGEHEMVNWVAAMEGGSGLVGGTVEKQGERLRVHIGFQCVDAVEPPQGWVPGTIRPFGVRRHIRVDRITHSAAELIGTVNAVVFSAEDIELIQGPPSLRRRYLDILISQVDPLYLKSLQRYQRVLQQRNRLLRMLQARRAESEELKFWDRELIKEGSLIVGRRHQAMDSLTTLCRKRHFELTGSEEELTLEYRPSAAAQCSDTSSVAIGEEFARELGASRGKELEAGSTVVGPHRDDFRLRVSGVDMGTFASRGQARTLALTLRLGEASYLDELRQEGPIVLLDDVLSELDSRRRKHVLEKAAQYQQVIITSTDILPLQQTLVSNAAYFEIEGGQVSPTGT